MNLQANYDLELAEDARAEIAERIRPQQAASCRLTLLAAYRVGLNRTPPLCAKCVPARQNSAFFDRLKAL